MSELNLALVIETQGDKEALGKLDSLSKAGQMVVERFAKATNTSLDQAIAKYGALGDKAAMEMLRLAVAAEDASKTQTVAIDKVTASIEHGTKAHEPHIHGLSRIGYTLSTMVGHATGVAPVFERIGDAIGIMAFGHLATVGVLAGFAAIAFAYEKITEEAHKATKEIDASVGALLEWKKQQDYGVAGKLGHEVEDAEKRLDQKRTVLAQLAAVLARPASAQVFGEGVDQSESAAEAERARIQAQYDKLAKAVEAGEEHVRELKQKAGERTAADDLHNLAAVIAAHKANAGEIRNAEALLTGLRTSLNSLAGDGSQNAKRAELIAQIKELNDALHPKDADADKTRHAALEQAAAEWNHFVHEQQDAYKRTSEETVREFERAQDEETAIALTQANERAKNEQRAYKEASDRAAAAVAGSASRARGMDLAGLREATHKSLEEGGVLMDDAVHALADRMSKSLSTILGEGISAGFEKAFSGRAGDAFKSLTATVLAGLGGFMQALGAQMIVVGIGLEAFADAMLSLDGPAAILAGVALVAAGAGLKAIASNIGGSMTTGSSTGSPSNVAPTFLSFGVQAAGTSTTSMQAPSARPSNYFTIIGPDDPKAQRAIADIVNRADARGLVGAR